jgi:AraC-like DNA-binding protein
MEPDKNDTAADWLDRISPQLHLVGYHRGPGGWHDAGRAIADHALQVTGPDGHMRIEIDGTCYDCPAGHFVIIPPGVWARRFDVGGRDFRRYWIHFDWVFRGDWPVQPWRADDRQAARRLPDRPAPDFVPPGILHGPISNPRRFYQDMERLNDRFHHGGPRRRRWSRGLLLQLLLDLLSPAEGGQDEAAPPDAARGIRRALRDLAEAPFVQARPVREHLARRGRSYDHQARVFRAAYGLTPLQYVNELRMARAKALLADTAHPIKQIAHELGFTDVGYFDRLFRKVTGLSPTQYRAGLG